LVRFSFARKETREVVEGYAAAQLLSQEYGLEPAYIFLELLRKGTILSSTFFSEPPSEINVEGDAYLSISRRKDGYVFGVSSPGGFTYSYCWIWDVSAYDEVLILAKISIASTNIVGGIVLGVDKDNAYRLDLVPASSAKDIRLVKRKGGFESELGVLEVDIDTGVPNPYALYYCRTDGRIITWYKGSKAIDVVDTEVSPKYLGFGFGSTSSSWEYNDVKNPIIVVAK